jgi:hypothetical protein
MGHSTKGQGGQMEKTKEKIIYCWEKPKMKPPFNKKGNKRLSKKMINDVQSQKYELLILGTF